MSRANTGKQLLAKKFPFGTFQITEGGKVSVTFDFSKAPVPRDTYSASFVNVTPGPADDCFISFYQVDSDSGEVKHKLELKFDDLALLNAWINSKEFYDRAKTWYEATYGVALKPKGVVPIKTAMSHQLAANMVFVG